MPQVHSFGVLVDGCFYRFSQKPTGRVVVNPSTGQPVVEQLYGDGVLTIGYDQWSLRVRMPEEVITEEDESRVWPATAGSLFGTDETKLIRFSESPNMTCKHGRMVPCTDVQANTELTMSYEAWSMGKKIPAGLKLPAVTLPRALELKKKSHRLSV